MMPRLLLSLLLAAAATAAAAPTKPEYILGAQGADCTSTCMATQQLCVPHIDTGNNTALFALLGVNCSINTSAQGGVWWAPDQPSYVSAASDPNYGECLGYKGVPAVSVCGASMKDVRRVCHCAAPIPSSDLTFGTGLSGGGIGRCTAVGGSTRPP